MVAKTKINAANSADNIDKVEYPYSVWKRPSMYLGERGSQQSVGVREIVDNAVHESMRGFATKIRVIFGQDGSVQVQDDGRGLPTDINKKTGENGIILTMATLHAGENFKTNVATGKAGAGLNGVGASVANALSKRFDVIVYRDDKEYRLSFQNGFPGHFDGPEPDANFKPSDKITSKKDSRTAAEKKLFPHGTLIKLWYNEQRFPSDEAIDRDDLVARLNYISYIVPKLRIDVIDENKINEDGSYFENSFYSEDGLEEMVNNIAPDEVLPGSASKGDTYIEKGVYHIETIGSYREIVTDVEGHASEVDRKVTAEIAFRYGTGYERNFLSFANTIRTPEGGIHEEAVETAFLKTFSERMSSTRGLMNAKSPAIAKEDILEGMTVVVSVNVPEPQFKGQQKTSLSGPEVKRALTKAVTESLKKFVDSPSNQKFLRPMFEKVLHAAEARNAELQAKKAKRQSNQVSSASLPAKLSDCDITGTDESELLICEGDSAAGTIRKARDATFQAVMPIRGKTLNSFVATNDKVLANKEIMDIAKALGAGFGKNFDIDKIRYGKVLFAADADHDGLHICNLLYTVFNRMFKPMIEEGRVYQTVPPLYEVTVGSGKNQERIYVVDDSELSGVLRKLDKAGKSYKIERNKGLGEVTPQSFYDTVLDPSKRTLRRITLSDVEKAQEALELTMGKGAEARREFMEENFQIAIDSGLVDGYEEGIE